MHFVIVFAVLVLVALYTGWHYRRINSMIAACNNRGQVHFCHLQHA